MSNYYVPKKNRCSCYNGGGSCVGENCSGSHVMDTKTNFFTIPNSSSMNMVLSRSRTIYNSSLHMSVETKGRGNIQKQGSGGNSYVSYLSKKVGRIQCCQT